MFLKNVGNGNQATPHYVPQNSILDSHRYVKLKSRRDNALQTDLQSLFHL